MRTSGIFHGLQQQIINDLKTKEIVHVSIYNLTVVKVEVPVSEMKNKKIIFFSYRKLQYEHEGLAI